MATTKFYITSGVLPNDAADTGSTKFYVTSGFVPDTVAAAGGWGHKIMGVTPGKVDGVAVGDISKIDGT